MRKKAGNVEIQLEQFFVAGFTRFKVNVVIDCPSILWKVFPTISFLPHLGIDLQQSHDKDRISSNAKVVFPQISHSYQYCAGIKYHKGHVHKISAQFSGYLTPLPNFPKNVYMNLAIISYWRILCVVWYSSNGPAAKLQRWSVELRPSSIPNVWSFLVL